MASVSAKSCCCFLVAFFCFTLNVEAREGKLFFTKFTHLGTADKDVGPFPKPDPLSPAPAPGPAQAGGGHFGPGSGMIPQSKESWPVSSTTSDEEFDKLMAKFENETGYDENEDKSNEEKNYEADKFTQDWEYPSLEKRKYDYYNTNNGDSTYTSTNAYKSNDRHESMRGYGEERHGISDTRLTENDAKPYYDVEEERQNYESTPTTGRYESSNYNGNGERKGMSDTRFMEDGKYFYNVKGGHGGYESREDARREQSYRPNEFDTMEEYYKSIESSEENMP